MQNYAKFIKDTGVSGFVQIIVRLKGIILLPILTKTLGAEAYGVWSQILITVSFVSPFILWGLPEAFTRFIPGTKELSHIRDQILSVFIFILIPAIGISIIFSVYHNSIATLLKIPDSLVIFLGLLILFKSLNNSLLAVFHAFGEIVRFACFEFAITFGELVLVIGSIFLGLGITGAITSLLLIKIGTFLVASIIVFRKIGFAIPHFSRLREYLHFSIPSVFGSFSYKIVQASDRYIIAGFWGVLFVGYYMPAYALGNTLNILIISLVFVLQPTVTKLFAANKLVESKRYLSYSLKYLLLVSIPSVFGLTILASPLLTIFSTEEIARNASSIVSLVALSLFLYNTSTIFSQVLLLYKKTRILGSIWIGSDVINFMLNMLFIPTFGITGAAITTLISYFFAFALIWYFANRFFPFPIDWKFIFKSTLASLLMAGIVFLLHPKELWSTLFAITVGIVSYTILILLFKGITKKEITFFLSFLKQRNSARLLKEE